MEEGNDFPLQDGPEIDQDVAANDQIELGKWRIARQVLAREHAQIAYELVDAETAVALREDHAPGIVGVGNAGRRPASSAEWPDA